MPSDLPLSTLLSALDGARIAYFDGRLPETSILIAQEVIVIMFSNVSALLVIKCTTGWSSWQLRVVNLFVRYETEQEQDQCF